MSTSPIYYFRDTKTGADANATAGSDANSGLTDALAKQNYSAFIALFNSAAAGTRFRFARGSGLTQAATSQLRNHNSTATISSITRSGTTATATTSRVHNLEVSDTFNVYDAVPSEYSGAITVTAVPSTTTFTYEVSGSPATPATIDPRATAIHFDGAMIYVEDYLSTEYTQAVDADPYVTYSDETNRMHRIDSNSFSEGYSFTNMHYEDVGVGESRLTDCFFWFNAASDFFIIDGCTIDSFKIGAYANQQTASQTSIRLVNSTIQNCWSQGILGQFKNALIDNNTFTNNGHDNSTGGSGGLHNVYLSYPDYTTVSNNTLYQSALNSGSANGNSMITHGVCTGLIIEDNYIHEDIGACNSSAWGIAIDTGYATAEEFTDTIIRRNIIENMGNVGIKGNSWTGGAIENNLIFQGQTAFPSTAISLNESDTGTGNAENVGAAIRNNSIYGNFITGIRADFGTGFEIVSNVCQSTYTGTFNMLDVGLLSITDTTNFDEIDNNIAYAPSASAFNWETTETGTLAAWQAASIFDDDSSVEDPLYTSATDLTPQTGSPLIDSGHTTLSATEDYLEVTRDATPDIGAYEVVGGDVAAPGSLRGFISGIGRMGLR